MDLANLVAAVDFAIYFFIACCGLIPSFFNDILCFGKEWAS